jgi:hypothetical protein
MNKKILTVATVLSLLSINNAKADLLIIRDGYRNRKNKNNNSIGVYGSYNKTSYELETENYKLADVKRKTGTHAGSGLFYKYTHTFANSKGFIEPEFFYDFTEYENSGNAFTDDDNAKEKVKISPNAGFKLNLGGHINDKNDLYFSLGVQNINYEVEWRDDSINYKKSTSGNKLVGLFGIGYNYHINERVVIGWQGNATINNRFDAPGKIYLTNKGVSEQGKYRFETFNTKLGLGFKF